MSKITQNTIVRIISDRDRNLESRLGFMYMAIGVAASLAGLLVCIFCNAHIIGILSVAVILIGDLLLLAIGSKVKREDLTIELVAVGIIFLIPVVFVYSGGNDSGCPAWFIFQLYFITLACYGRALKIMLGIAGVIDLSLSVADMMGAGFIYHLPDEQSRTISTAGSWVVVCAAILASVIAFKQMFKQERGHLIEQAKELERANQHEKMFLANMSHELRTPINAVLGFNEMIRRNTDDKELLEFSNDILRSTDHLLSLVNDILDLSKIEAGELTLNPAEYNIYEGVFRSYDIVKVRAEEKGLKLVVEVDPGIPRIMKGDRERDVQIALNLLTNAIKYTEKGTITFKVYTEKIPGDDKHVSLYIVVSDTGIGIEKENLEKIFSAYKRIESRVSMIEGTGLGLAITKNYVEMMGGELTVDSVVGKGSTFTARIVQEVIDPAPVGVENIEQHAYSSMEVYKPRTFDGNKTILVVDDTRMNLKVISSLLKKSGCQIETVDGGQKAIDYVADGNRVDLILMDIMMPGMSGIEAFQKIREINETVPIIALTADAVSGAREEYLEIGFNGYLPKPVKADVLDRTIGMYI